MSQPGQLNTHDDLLKTLVKEASDVLSDGNVTFGEVVRLGGLLASKANQFQQLSGLQKRDLVLKAVEEALVMILEAKGPLPEKFEEQMVHVEFQKKVKEAAFFAKETLPSVLDLAVDAARGKIDLRKPEVHKTCLSLFSLLFQCIAHRKVEEPKKENPPQQIPKEEKTVVPETVKVVEEKPAEEKPAEEKPVEEKPAEEKPVEQEEKVEKVEMISPPESTS